MWEGHFTDPLIYMVTKIHFQTRVIKDECGCRKPWAQTGEINACNCYRTTVGSKSIDAKSLKYFLDTKPVPESYVTRTETRGNNQLKLTNRLFDKY